MKKQNGITIISLVVTIIILIILAGVSINLILGENGIITKAKEAKTKTEQATLNEEIALNELYYQISETSDSSISYDDIEALVEFKRKIASAITDMGIETSESASVDTMASNIRSISGASSAEKVSYDNTNSGLTATNVQSAVDEVNSSLGGLVGKDYSGTYTSSIGTWIYNWGLYTLTVPTVVPCFLSDEYTVEITKATMTANNDPSTFTSFYSKSTKISADGTIECSVGVTVVTTANLSARGGTITYKLTKK